MSYDAKGQNDPYQDTVSGLPFGENALVGETKRDFKE